MGIILASRSPRRRELLRTMGIEKFEVRPVSGEETYPAGAAPAEAVTAISARKGRLAAAAAGPADTVIAADTLVFLDALPLGKPRDEADALRMLRALSGREHEVWTGVAVLRGGRELLRAVRTLVRFRPLSEEEIRTYVATGEPMDKAGAYGAQGRGCVFVERIDGDFFNVMGLPVCTLYTMLRELDS
jgi:septum formation protein